MKKQSRLDRSYHKLILRSLVLTAGISILITGLSLSSFFLSKINENLEEYNNAQLKSVQDEITNIKDFVSQAGYLVVQDSLTKKFLHHYGTIDYLELGNLLTRVKNASLVKDYIDSIYLVYPNQNLTLTSNGIYSWDTFRDKTWLEAVDQTKHITWYGSHSICTDKMSEVKTSVVSAIFTLSRYYPGREGYVVMNISDTRMCEALEKGDYKNSYFMLSDDKNQPITASPGTPVNGTEEVFELPSSFSQDKKETSIKTDSGRFLATLQQDHRDGWYYYILTPQAEANASLFQSMIYILVVLCIAVTVSCLVSLRLRNRAYSPVKQLIETADAQSAEGAGKHGQYVEFRQISHRFQSILLEKYNIESQINSMLPAMKERLFRKLLSGQIIGNDALQTQLELLNLDLSPFSSYVVLSLRVDNPDTRHASLAGNSPKEEIWLSMLSVKNQAEIFKQQNFRLLSCFENSINSLVCVLAFTKEDSFHIITRAFLDFLLDSHPDSASLTVGVGNPVSTFASLQISSNQALEALEQSCIYGKSQILFFRDVSAQSNLNYLNPLSYEKALSSAVRVCGKEEICTILNHIDNLLYDNHYDLRMIRHFYLGIINFISLFDQESTDGQQDAGDSTRILVEKIYSAASLSEIRFIVEESCFAVAEAFRQAGQKKAENSAAQICNYLTENYMQDLSLDDVAERFQYTGAYVNRIIKRHTGMTFYDMLTDIRITRSKQLLHHTELQVYQVAEQTGYSNVQSFIRMFKKITGITPGAYRKEQNSWEG